MYGVIYLDRLPKVPSDEQVEEGKCGLCGIAKLQWVFVLTVSLCHDSVAYSDRHGTTARLRDKHLG